MDLKIKDVAELLKVSEKTIRQWLFDGKIPAYKLNRQYRFSRIEIENWMMKRKLKITEKGSLITEEQMAIPTDSPAIAGAGMLQFSLYRAINRGGVHVDIKGTTKEEIIRGAVKEIAGTLGLDAEGVTELLLEREQLMSTAFNNGVAVPHARECLSDAAFDVVSVVFPKNPIEYGALNGRPVSVLFFIFATGDKIHLHLLSKIAHLASNEKALSFLNTRPSKTALLEYIRDWEGQL